MNTELRLGNIGDLLFGTVLEKRKPNQLELLDFLFPGLLIVELPSDGKTKTPAEYIDVEGCIKAVRYQSFYYTGGNNRASQITGRLIGTARGSQTKERKTASLIQERIASQLAVDPDKIDDLRERYLQMVKPFTEEVWDRFIDTFADYINAVIDHHMGLDQNSRLSELFPIKDEVARELFDNIIDEWNTGSIPGYINAFTWLVLGALLRDEVGRLNYVYDSAFELRRARNVGRQASGTEHPPAISDRAASNEPAPEEYVEYFYEGDDLDNLYPGIDWYCDRCGALLTGQPGFNDHHKIWKCRRCGYKNLIDIENIFDSEEDFQSGAPHTDPEGFYKALLERSRELEGDEEDPEIDS